MDQDAIAAVVKEIEEEQAYGRRSTAKVFKGMLNQPALVSVSSVNANAVASGDSYTSFTVDMPRPILEVDNLQLATVNIPLCTQNIPDTACAFWYYRMSLYSGTLPNPNNLFFIRLLPSYYRPEFINESEKFGFNQTFGGYTDLAAQLKLASEGDLAQENFTAPFGTNTIPPNYRIQYMKDEAIITYNSLNNKFQFSGNQGLPLSERDPQLVSVNWSAVGVYVKGNKVKDTVYVQGEGYIVYYALLNNTGQALPVFPREYNTYWSRAYGFEGVANWSASTAYKIGQFVSDSDNLYKAVDNTFNNDPPNQLYWDAINDPPEFPPVYQYLVAGPNDPNVVFMQGTSQRTWSEYALYEEQDNVLYNGITYKATKQNIGYEPFYVPNSTDNEYSNTRQYSVGDYAFVAGSPGRYYINIKASKGVAPAAGLINNANWNYIEYDPNRPTGSTPPTSTFYQVGDIVTYVGYAGTPFFRCIKKNPPAASLTGDSVRFGQNEFWEISYWATGTSVALVPYVGLAKISGDLDMMDDYDEVNHSPFPAGIPPQPFNPNPKRLLNSILGFTWNGKFTPTSLNIVYDPVTQTTDAAGSQLINRVRPLPVYYQGGPPALVGYDPTSIQDTFLFTANGYATLVYTAIISVYATIVGGSTLDTQRNTNLMGTMAMSAGNLGIGFGANYIEVPLRTGDGDIYSMTFEFRDDYDEPYPLTNNAAVTITLKLGYK
jgi:hypothetical protein